MTCPVTTLTFPNYVSCYMQLPQNFKWLKGTHLATCSHPHSIQLPKANVNHYSQFYLYTTSPLWNTLFPLA